MSLKMGMVIAALSFSLGSCGSDGDKLLSLDTPLAEFTSEGAGPRPESLSHIEETTENIVLVEMQEIYHLGQLNPELDEYQWTLTVSEVEVVDVIEGTLEVGEKIHVGEPYYLSHGEDLQSMGGYIPMNTGEEYLLFLSELSDNTWLEEPVDSWTINYLGYGQYQPHKEAITFNRSLETYSDLLAYDFVVVDEEEIDIYESIQKEVADNYFYIFD